MAKGILLPPNAPPAYADRQTLWNAVEKAEDQWNSQLARGIIVALPRELPKTECEALIRDYCREQFVSLGMIADFAIHEQKGISTEIGDYNRQVKAHNSRRGSLKRQFAELTAWLKGVIEKIAVLTEKETQPPTILDFIRAYDEMRKAGRADWSVKGKQTATVNDVKFAARVFAWMETTGIYTLDDFNSVVSEHNAYFAKVAENTKSIRRLDTALKHIDTMVSLKPIYEQSKKGFDRRKEKYVVEHKDELERFKKAVRYMKSNGLTPEDCSRCEKERKNLLRENERLEQKFRSINLDPELMAQIKYRISKVLDAGEMPQHKTTTKELLTTRQSSNKETNPPEKHNERKEVQGLEER